MLPAKSAYTQLFEDIKSGFDNISDEATAGARDLVNSMQPSIQDLEEMAQSYFDAGKIPPENVRKGLEDAYELNMMAGNTEYMFRYLAGQIADSRKCRMS